MVSYLYERETPQSNIRERGPTRAEDAAYQDRETLAAIAAPTLPRNLRHIPCRATGDNEKRGNYDQKA